MSRRSGELIDIYSTDRRLLSKATVALYEDVQEFWVAVRSTPPRPSRTISIAGARRPGRRRPPAGR